MFKQINKHMPGDHRSVAEEFRNTNEDEFQPRLEDVYWSNPNSQRGTIVTCTQAINNIADTPRLYDTSPIKSETRRTEGI